MHQVQPVEQTSPLSQLMQLLGLASQCYQPSHHRIGDSSTHFIPLYYRACFTTYIPKMVNIIRNLSFLAIILTGQGGVIGISGYVIPSQAENVSVGHRSRDKRVSLSSNLSHDSPSFISQSTSSEQSISVEALLWNRLTDENDTSIVLEGCVLSKRSLGKGLVFADFYIPTYQDTCQAMLRADSFEDDFTAARKLLLKGTKVRLTGTPATTRIPGNVVLVIESLEFMNFPRDLQYIQMLIQQYRDGIIPECCMFESLPHDNTRTRLRQLRAANSSSDSKPFLKLVARDILASLPEDPDHPEAADLATASKSNSFVVPEAPSEWRWVPESIGRREAYATSTDTISRTLERVGSILPQDNRSPITISGWVQNRRRFDGNITMVALVDDFASLGTDDCDAAPYLTERLLAILHPDLISSPVAGIYRNLAAVGSKLRLTGVVAVEESSPSSRERSDERRSGVLWVTSIRLQQSSSRSVTVCHLLDLVHEGVIDRDEACPALLITTAEEARSLTSMDPTQRRWKANELAVRLQDATSASAVYIDSSRDLGMLEKYKRLAESHPIEETTLEVMEKLLSTLTLAHAPSMKEKQPARAVLPLGMPGSTWQRKKRPQLAWMGEQIRQVLESHADYGKRKLQILDIGGGKGSLAQYVGQTFYEKVEIQVVDICEGAVANGARKAKRLNLPIDFSLADASQALNLTHVDVVVALHACGHLSDVALAHALQRKAGFVIVPCCFNSNPHLTIPTCNNQKITVPAWLDIPEDDWSRLKLLAEIQGDVTLANEAIATLCAVRANAARRYQSSDITTVDGRQNHSPVTVKRFPIEFSTRNTVLVGKCR
jgi:2-polyprenyl-3-methyl-5-hydroxy-6-metoxy-1,4-benzoquinol methylase